MSRIKIYHYQYSTLIVTPIVGELLLLFRVCQRCRALWSTVVRRVRCRYNTAPRRGAGFKKLGDTRGHSWHQTHRNQKSSYFTFFTFTSPKYYHYFIYLFIYFSEISSFLTLSIFWGLSMCLVYSVLQCTMPICYVQLSFNKIKQTKQNGFLKSRLKRRGVWGVLWAKLGS